mmetsp:Transcript_36894/g.77904  ORF Transcript_36894/g.77904 Transcript_36894/m.77904 type:complete len:91 (-) Transcript_36894:38-310(-)
MTDGKEQERQRENFPGSTTLDRLDHAIILTSRRSEELNPVTLGLQKNDKRCCQTTFVLLWRLAKSTAHRRYLSKRKSQSESTHQDKKTLQ